MTRQQVAIAITVVLLIVVAGAGWYYWAKRRGSSGFHGWRHQDYEDNPYNGQTYCCGLGALGYRTRC